MNDVTNSFLVESAGVYRSQSAGVGRRQQTAHRIGRCKAAAADVAEANGVASRHRRAAH